MYNTGQIKTFYNSFKEVIKNPLILRNDEKLRIEILNFFEYKRKPISQEIAETINICKTVNQKYPFCVCSDEVLKKNDINSINKKYILNYINEIELGSSKEDSLERILEKIKKENESIWSLEEITLFYSNVRGNILKYETILENNKISLKFYEC